VPIAPAGLSGLAAGIMSALKRKLVVVSAEVSLWFMARSDGACSHGS